MNDVIKAENKICSAIFDDVLAKQIKNNLQEMRNNKIQELEDSYNLANEFTNARDEIISIISKVPTLSIEPLSVVDSRISTYIENYIEGATDNITSCIFNTNNLEVVYTITLDDYYLLSDIAASLHVEKIPFKNECSEKLIIFEKNSNSEFMQIFANGMHNAKISLDNNKHFNRKTKSINFKSARDYRYLAKILQIIANCVE